MGMYDELCGEQVKAFYVPCFYSSSMELGYMGGEIRYYNKGDDIEYKTWWYRYPTDFLIVDFDVFDCVNHVFHLIQDGKYVETYYSNAGDKDKDIKDIPEDIFPITAVLMYGDIFTFESKGEIFEYLYENMVAYSKYNEILSQNKTDYSELRILVGKQNENPSKENEQKIKEFWEEEKKRNLDITEKRNEIFEKIKTKWPITNVTHHYGAYLDCIHDCIQQNRDEDYILKLRDVFAEYKKNHSFEEYLAWYEPTENEKDFMTQLNDFV